MAKILLFSFSDHGSSGIRQIASFLRMHGHLANLVLVEGEQKFIETVHIPPEFCSDEKSFAPLSKSMLWKGRMNFYSIAPYTLPDCFFHYLQDWRPDLIGFSTRLLPGIPFAKWFAQIRKTCPEALLIAGGFGPSIAPEVFLDAKADIVVRGEGEYALLELANCLDNKTSWASLDNLSYTCGGRVTHNPLRPIERNISKFPQPLLYAPGIFYTKGEEMAEQDVLLHSWLRDVLSGRGCIGSCSYCCAGNLRNLYRDEGLIHPKYRYRDTDSVLGEMLLHKEHGAPFLRIIDDFFIRPPDEMRHFLTRYAETVSLPFSCNFPADYLHRHPDILDKADLAGLFEVSVNIQSSAEPLVRDIFNRKNRYPVIENVIQTAYKKYLPVHIDFLEGYSIPGMDDLEEKLAFIKKLPPFRAAYPEAIFFQISHLSIQPNATIEQYCPDIHTYLLSSKEYLYRAMLMYFRYILDDESFMVLRSNKAYQNDPAMLPELFRRAVNARHTDYLLQQANRLKNKEVYFWGLASPDRKALFAKSKPVAIIDSETNAAEIDGIPLVKTADILKERPLPVIIFAWQSMQVLRSIKRLLPEMPDEDLILCLPNEFPEQANTAKPIRTILEVTKSCLAWMERKIRF